MKKTLILMLCLMMILLSIYIYSYIQLLPRIKEYGQMELERFNQLIVTHSYMTQQSVYEEFVIIERNEHSQIEVINFDMIKINKLANDIIMDIESKYLQIENQTYVKKNQSHYETRVYDVSKKGILSKIPLSSLISFPIFPFLFPTISVQYKHLSKVNSTIIKKIENYGINHIIVELIIEITMDHTMVYPFFEQYHSHSVEIPILLEIFQGQIPIIYTQ